MSDNAKPLLAVVTGPTASGKTSLAIELALRLHCDIVSADSRQIYRGIPIGTAAPTQAEREAVRHHMVECFPLDHYYSAACYENVVVDVLLPELMARDGCAVLCGGSMMYVDAVVRGIDPLPTISDEVRGYVAELYRTQGIEALRQALRAADPEYLATADPANHRRLMHALEITLEAGVPASSLRTGAVKESPFRVVKIAIDYSREERFARINRRVDAMISAGFEQEARSVYHLRHLNSLNTVGYKEMFAYFDGDMDRATAIARIAKNTRVYAKKQLTWLAKDASVVRLAPGPDLADRAYSLLKA